MVVLAAGLFFTTFRKGGHNSSPGAGPARAPWSDAQEKRVDLEHRVTDFTTGFGQNGGYRPPSTDERATVADAVDLLLDHREQAARERLDGIGFVLRTITDSGTGRRFAEVADTREGRTGNRGWGRVYVDLTSPVRWSVQVPHPVADEDSEKLGVGVLRGTPGGVMVLAGAHRRAGEGNAADVAHRQDTVFDAVCGELTRRGLPGIQVHGFADSTQPGYDAIVSTGKADDARTDARTLAAALTRHHLTVCRAWTRNCSLEGRTNEQGSEAAAHHVPFLHVEFSRSTRAHDRTIAEAVAAMNAVTSVWNDHA